MPPIRTMLDRENKMTNRRTGLAIESIKHRTYFPDDLPAAVTGGVKNEIRVYFDHPIAS